ncbi:pyridoxal-dependent decarboxylase [Candidatus Poriferisodalis multihospitum]|uniref:pyridoxal-dependent decarboxylase n=1 Tax=Candidatus Poriferisodalis multihospitum TaxID=2983191 RepID=UPI002B25ED3E|nr:pyridoxal-dependent decarboxylase [Candidatus Poriferisodalis multihospitum]
MDEIDPEVTSPPAHMTPEEFRRHGREVIDWIADYWERIESLPVASAVQPGDIRALLPDSAPEQPEPFEHLLADLDRVVVPGVTHWQHPGWFAYFPANNSPPSVLADAVSSGLGLIGLLWSASPALTEIESHMLDWLVDLCALPEHWKTTSEGGGVLQGSASDATHVALVAARHRVSARSGQPAEQMVAYTSAQAHSSVEKGANIAGFGQVRLVEVDEHQAMRPDALAASVEADISAGLVPTFVGSTVGTTGTTAVDPVRAISAIAIEHSLWHHVDAAYAGTAMICPEFRHHNEGIELVDSYVFNPHKWMMVNFDCSAFYVADKAALTDALSIDPPYLRNTQSDAGNVIDYRNWQVPLGRRFRALKLWWVLRSYGAAGIRQMVRHHVAMAQEFAQRLNEDSRFEIVAPHPFSLVCFRVRAADASEEAAERADRATDALAAAVNDSSRAYLTPSKLDGRSIIRVAVGQSRTDRSQMDLLWKLISEAAV